MEIISRAEARERSLKRYFTGKPCTWNHVAERFVDNGGCSACGQIRTERWRLANMEQSRAAHRAWRKANPEKDKAYAVKFREQNPESWKASNARHYQKNLTDMRARNVRRYAEDPEAFRAIARRWRQANPEAIKAFKHARRAREYGAGGRYTKADIEALFVEQSGLCNGCRADFCEISYTIDHKIPLARGGTNDPENLQLLCQPCNASKNARTMEEWL